MRYWLLLFATLIASTALGQAANIQVTPTGSSTGNCTGGAVTIFTPTQFNNSANWGNSAGKIGNDTHVLLCGTFSSSTANGSPILSVQGSGSSGHPIVITADTGMTITNSAYFGANGGLYLGNNSWLTLNGNQVGTIQNTGNGTSLANQGAGNLMSGGNISNVTIEGWTIANCYVYTSSSDENANIQSTGGISFPGTVTNVTVMQNTVHDCPAGIYFTASGGSNLSITYNTVTKFNWGLACTGCTISGLNVSNNDVSTASYDDALDNFHHNGFIMFPQSAGTGCTNCAIHDNYFHDINGHTTAFIFIDPADGNANGLIVYNNVGRTTTGGGPANASWTMGIGVTGATVVNNTMIGATAQAMSGGIYSTVFKNNISENMSVGEFLNTVSGNCNTSGTAVTILPQPYYPVQFSGEPITINSVVYAIASVTDSTHITLTTSAGTQSNVNWTIHPYNVTSDYNDWYNLSTGFVSGSTYSTLAAWKSATGLDTNSINTNPNLTASGTLNAGSPAIGTGTNLTSLGVTGLDQGAPQTFGVGGGCGTGCVARSATNPWDMGAYPSSSGGGSVTLTPSPENFGFVPLGNSSLVSFTLTNNSSATVSGISPSVTGGNSGDFVVGNVGLGSCNAAGNTIAVGASCAVAVTFTPSVIGTRSTTLNISYTGGDGASPQTSALTGQGTGQVCLKCFVRNDEKMEQRRGND